MKDASTLYVGYNYDTTAASGEYTKGLRPTSVRYPNARLVHLTYGSSGGTGDATARVEAIKDDSGGSPGTLVLGIHVSWAAARSWWKTTPSPT